MFRKELLRTVRPAPESDSGLIFIHGIEREDTILSGRARDPSTGKNYPIKNGYLDLLGGRFAADNIANLTNFLPGAGRLYEPLWRRRSLTRLTGERFPNQRELKVISELAWIHRGGTFLDLGCSAGMYARNLARTLGNRGDIVGIDISPSMLKEAARLARKNDSTPSFARADAENLPFGDGAFTGVVCGGSLNEIGDPARALGEAHRVLASGGRIAIMGILAAQGQWAVRLQRFLSTGGIRFFKGDEIESLLKEAGFEPEPLRTHGPVFFAGATRRD